MADTKKLKKAAEIMFIEQGKNQKEIALIFGLSEKTISSWATKEKWKDKRSAFMNTPKKRADDIKQVISNLTERRLEIFKEVDHAKRNKDAGAKNDLDKESVSIGQEIAMHTKALAAIDKSGKPTLSIYLEIMDDVFKALSVYDQNLYLKTIEFQESHIATIADKLA